MPITYEPTDRLIRYYHGKLEGKLKLSPNPEVLGYLVAFGTGVILSPLILSLFGYTMKRVEVRAKRAIRKVI